MRVATKVATSFYPCKLLIQYMPHGVGVDNIKFEGEGVRACSGEGPGPRGGQDAREHAIHVYTFVPSAKEKYT